MDIKFDTVKQLSADSSVIANMEEYQQYLAESKLPHPIDGLKDVARRAIYLMGTNKESTKFAQFIASIMQLHPHGDGSIKDAVERLFRPWDIGIPLIVGTGNIGSYVDPPAAARYLNVTSSEFARDLFFNGVHQTTIPMKYTVEYDAFEPKYFIPRLPTALLISNLTIGAGFKSLIFPLELKNVCELVQRYLDYKDSHAGFSCRGIGHLFVPEFPTQCELRNYDYLVNAYDHGRFNAKVYTDGMLEVYKNKIAILNMPARSPYNSMFDKIIELLKSKTFWMNPLIRDVQNIKARKGDQDCKNHGGLIITFKQNVDVWNILNQFKKTIGFTRAISPIPNYEVEGVSTYYTPLDVLKHWYKARYYSITNGLNTTLNQLLKDKLVIEALMCIVDNKDDVVNIIKNADTREVAIAELSDKFDITNNQAYNICKASLDKLIKASKDDLISSHDKLDKDITSVCQKYKSIDNTIYEDATYFSNKYRKTRATKIPTYIGYAKISNKGIFQYESMDELTWILNNHNVNSIHQYRYPKCERLLITEMGVPVVSTNSIAKHEQGLMILEKQYTDEQARTIVYMGDSVAYINGYNFPKDDTTVQFVTDKIIGFNNTGIIEKCSINEFSQRKTISTGAKNDLIYAISDKQHKNKVVVYMSTSPGYSNEVFFTKIYDKDTDTYNRLTTTPPHELIIIDVLDMNDKDIIINIPRKCVNVNIEYLLISDVSKIVNTSDTKAINIRSGQYVSTDGKKSRVSRYPDYQGIAVL